MDRPAPLRRHAEPLSAELRDQPELSYGWGVYRSRSPWAHDLPDLADAEGRVYLVPLKVAVRRAEGIDVGDEVLVRVRVGAPARR